MFGNKDKEVDPVRRAAHYAAAAKRFALDAKMFRCRAAVHVENKDDIAFWGTVLKHFSPEDKFHFIAGSRNEYGRETFGVTQCLKYYNYLSPGFFICIDSDYRFLMRTEGIDVEHFVLQTYTYSFENHHCFADGLSDVCSRATRVRNTVFDFRRFLWRYSRILYELFVWHLFFQEVEPSLFTQAEFDAYIGLPNSKYKPLTRENAEPVLREWQDHVKRKTETLRRRFPEVDLEGLKARYRQLGLTPETTYLFVRGHNMYDLISLLCKEVCKAILRKAKRGRQVSPERLREVYRGRYNVDNLLRQHIKYEEYEAIRRIEEDVRKLLG